jgi:hypothetical protein
VGLRIDWERAVRGCVYKKRAGVSDDLFDLLFFLSYFFLVSLVPLCEIDVFIFFGVLGAFA